MFSALCLFFFFQAEDGIRDAQESRGLGDVYKRQEMGDGDLLRLLASDAVIARVDPEQKLRIVQVLRLSLIHI